MIWGLLVSGYRIDVTRSDAKEEANVRHPYTCGFGFDDRWSPSHLPIQRKLGLFPERHSGYGSDSLVNPRSDRKSLAGLSTRKAEGTMCKPTALVRARSEQTVSRFLTERAEGFAGSLR